MLGFFYIAAGRVFSFSLIKSGDRVITAGDVTALFS